MKNKLYFWSWLGTMLVSGLIIFGVFAPSFFSVRHRPLAGFIFSLYSPLCHQKAERSYHLFGQQLSVCSRCLGIYAGFFVSAVIYLLLKPAWKVKIEQHPRLLVWLALPMGADVAAGWLNLWESALWLKTATGLVWAAILPFFWFKALREFYQERSRQVA
ncbi:MAG: DUF2085 domain-containing protein [Candidatus Saccharicenans sp.]